MNALFLRAREVFDRVEEMPEPQRDAALAELCGGDPELRSRVESLLAARGSMGAFLDRPALEMTIAREAASETCDTDEGLPAGARLGSYTIRGVIGRGGMGEVYLAEQEHPRRTVALKLIRSPLVSPAILRRFDHEASVLARLKHPGIAQVFEAGSARGPDGRVRPFFAMELVQGRALLDFAAGLAVRPKLALFARVCDAVHHAHQKGVIHRDLKPANILVEPSDGTTGHDTGSSILPVPEGQPKVLDFGVARLTDADVAATMQTSVGQVIGTLAYMSPEQIRGDSERLDTRSDVYALGVVLYQLLSGRLPHDLRGASLPEAARIITEEDAPPLPATRELRGDVSTIVARALAKEPERRYQSAAELAADLRRVLTDLPIAARPATASYQLRKFARRNKALVAGVAAAFVMLLLGVVGTSVGMIRARDAQGLAEARETRATIEARKANKAIDFLVGMLTSASPEQTEGREVTVRELLDSAAERVSRELADEPEVLGTVESAIGRTFEAIGKTDSARTHLEAATALSRRTHGEGSIQEAMSLLHEVSLATHERRWPEAQALSERALATIRASAPADLRSLAAGNAELGLALAGQRKNDEAIPALRESLRLHEAAGTGGSDDAAEVMQTLGVTLGRKGGAAELTEGETLLRRATEIKKSLFGATNVRYAGAVAYLASFYYTQSRSADARPLYEEALPVYTKSYGETDRRTLELTSSLGRTYMQLGDLEKAEAFALRAVEGFRATGQGETAEAAAALSRLAVVCHNRKNLDAAERYHREALELRRKLRHADTPVSLGALASLLSERGRHEEAAALLREAIEMDRERGFPRADAAANMLTLARTLLKMGRDAEGEEMLGRAAAFARDRMPKHQVRASIEHDLGALLLRLERPADAVEPAQHAADVYRDLRHARLAPALTLLAQALDGAGRTEDAARVRAEAASLPQPPAAAAK